MSISSNSGLNWGQKLEELPFFAGPIDRNISSQMLLRHTHSCFLIRKSMNSDILYYVISSNRNKKLDHFKLLKSKNKFMFERMKFMFDLPMDAVYCFYQKTSFTEAEGINFKNPQKMNLYNCHECKSFSKDFYTKQRRNTLCNSSSSISSQSSSDSYLNSLLQSQECLTPSFPEKKSLRIQNDVSGFTQSPNDLGNFVKVVHEVPFSCDSSPERDMKPSWISSTVSPELKMKNDKMNFMNSPNMMMMTTTISDSKVNSPSTSKKICIEGDYTEANVIEEYCQSITSNTQKLQQSTTPIFINSSHSNFDQEIYFDSSSSQDKNLKINPDSSPIRNDEMLNEINSNLKNLDSGDFFDFYKEFETAENNNNNDEIYIQLNDLNDQKIDSSKNSSKKHKSVLSFFKVPQRSSKKKNDPSDIDPGRAVGSFSNNSSCKNTISSTESSLERAQEFSVSPNSLENRISPCIPSQAKLSLVADIKNDSTTNNLYFPQNKIDCDSRVKSLSICGKQDLTYEVFIPEDEIQKGSNHQLDVNLVSFGHKKT